MKLHSLNDAKFNYLLKIKVNIIIKCIYKTLIYINYKYIYMLVIDIN